MRTKSLKRMAAAAVITAATGAASLTASGTAQAMAPGDLTVCDRPESQLLIADESGASTSLLLEIGGPRYRCRTHDWNLATGEKLDISVVPLHGETRYLGSVTSCGGGHKVWIKGNVVKAHSCG